MSQGETYVRLFHGGSSLLVPMSFVLNTHPGGAEYILQYANEDITTAFADMNHSTDALSLLQTFEETVDKRDCAIYDPDHEKRLSTAEAAAEALTAEARRLREVRWWRLRQWCATAVTVTGAVAAVAVVLRRGSVQAT